MGEMSMTLFRKILDEVATIPQIDQVCITGLSETLLDRHLMERIRYAREKKPDAFIDFFTNGLTLNPTVFETAKAAGITCVSVSLNAVTAEQHDRVMHMGLKAFDRICSNIDYAIANAGRVQILVKAVSNGDSFTHEDTIKFIDRWGWAQDGGHGQPVFEGNWVSENRTIPIRTKRVDPKSCCDRAVGQIYVLWDGLVTLCCFDPLGAYARKLTGHPDALGNLNTQTIREVYAKEPWVQFRLDHWENRADKYDYCRKCSRI